MLQNFKETEIEDLKLVESNGVNNLTDCVPQDLHGIRATIVGMLYYFQKPIESATIPCDFYGVGNCLSIHSSKPESHSYSSMPPLCICVCHTLVPISATFQPQRSKISPYILPQLNQSLSESKFVSMPLKLIRRGIVPMARSQNNPQDATEIRPCVVNKDNNPTYTTATFPLRSSTKP